MSLNYPFSIAIQVFTFFSLDMPILCRNIETPYYSLQIYMHLLSNFATYFFLSIRAMEIDYPDSNISTF